jgi:predicted methyltransferase
MEKNRTILQLAILHPYSRLKVDQNKEAHLHDAQQEPKVMGKYSPQ